MEDVSTSKYRVAIIEIDHHPEVLRNTISLFRELEINCLVFTLEEIWTASGFSNTAEGIETHLIHKRKDIKSFFRDKVDLLNSCNLIYFLTMETNYISFLKLPLVAPKLLLVHNANTYLNPLQSIYPKLSLKYIRKDISYILLNCLCRFDLYYRRQFVQRYIDFFIFPAPEISNYMVKKKYLPQSKIVPFFPLAFRTAQSHTSKKNKQIVISILGSIEHKRRDYHLVLKAFKNILPRINCQVELRFLGRTVGSYGNRIIRNFKKLESETFKFIYFEKYLDQDTFVKHTNQTDFLIIPVYKFTKYKLFKEKYGYTKISGNIYDVVTYNKPALIHSSYPAPHNIKEALETFNNCEQLEELLYTWINDKVYKRISFENINREYNKKNVAKMLKNALSTINLNE